MSSSTDNPHERSAHALTESAYVGAGAGAIGALIGTGVATLKSRSATISAIAAGGPAFLLGSIFWYSRSTLLQNTRPGYMSRPREVAYSIASGSIAGAAAGALVGRRNVIPGALVMGCVGGAGDVLVKGLAGVRAGQGWGEDGRPILVRLSEKEWWPLKSLSDEDYEGMLRDKIRLAEEEIRGLDGQIETLRARVSVKTASGVES